MIDKITSLAVPPGNSLTDPPGKWVWEKPAQFPNPDDAIDHTIEMIENGTAREDMIKMMFAGITVEEIVEQITFKGFMAGAITPDVAELIKPALGVFLVNMALEEGFEPQMFVDQGEVSGQVSDEDLFTIMKQRNPQMFSTVLENLSEMHRMGKDMDKAEFEANTAKDIEEALQQNESKDSFLASRGVDQ